MGFRAALKAQETDLSVRHEPDLENAWDHRGRGGTRPRPPERLVLRLEM